MNVCIQFVSGGRAAAFPQRTDVMSIELPHLLEHISLDLQAFQTIASFQGRASPAAKSPWWWRGSRLVEISVSPMADHDSD
jgi:two-component system nitrogen regulation sensor histidine kinase GlnL